MEQDGKTITKIMHGTIRETMKAIHLQDLSALRMIEAEAVDSGEVAEVVEAVALLVHVSNAMKRVIWQKTVLTLIKAEVEAEVVAAVEVTEIASSAVKKATFQENALTRIRETMELVEAVEEEEEVVVLVTNANKKDTLQGNALMRPKNVKDLTRGKEETMVAQLEEMMTTMIGTTTPAISTILTIEVTLLIKCSRKTNGVIRIASRIIKQVVGEIGASSD